MAAKKKGGKKPAKKSRKPKPGSAKAVRAACGLPERADRPAEAEQSPAAPDAEKPSEGAVEAARRELLDLGVPAGVLEKLPEPALVAIADALHRGAELLREVSGAVADLKKACALVTARKAAESDARDAYQEAKRLLAEAREAEHDATVALTKVGEPGTQATLPLKPAEGGPGETQGAQNETKGPQSETEGGPAETSGAQDETPAAPEVPAQVLADLRDFFGSMDPGGSVAVTLSGLRELAGALEGGEKPGPEVVEAAVEVLIREGLAAKHDRPGLEPGYYRPEPPKPAPKTKAQRAAAKASATEPHPDSIEAARRIVESMARLEKVPGLGPSALAAKLFGDRSAEMKARALTILEKLEASGDVRRCEGANKEPSFYPVNKGAEAREEARAEKAEGA